jgi:hypothetical protein
MARIREIIHPLNETIFNRILDFAKTHGITPLVMSG